MCMHTFPASCIVMQQSRVQYDMHAVVLGVWLAFAWRVWPRPPRTETCHAQHGIQEYKHMVWPCA